MVLGQLFGSATAAAASTAQAEANTQAARVGRQIVKRAAEDVDGIARVVASPLVEDRSFLAEATSYVGQDISGWFNAAVVFPVASYATWATTRDNQSDTRRALQAIAIGLITSFAYSILWVNQL